MRKTLLVATLMLLPFTLGGCPKGTPYHDAVVAEHDFKTTVQAFQTAELAEFNAGNISATEHAALEGGILKVALAGQTLTTALQSGAVNSSVLGDFATLAAALGSLNTDGVLGIKNATSKAEFSTFITTLQGIVTNVGIFLNAPPAPTAAAPTA